MNKNYIDLLLYLEKEVRTKKVGDISKDIEEYVGKLSKEQVIEIVKEIGVIPEQIDASSTTEKVYSKCSDIVLSRCFKELGLESRACDGRGNSADVEAISKSVSKYELVADSKTFRISRSAKNQKDYKVSALSKWRNHAQYSVLVAPYFQYPNTKSQIYSTALQEKVTLFSWEHLRILLELDIKETSVFNLSNVWQLSDAICNDRNRHNVPLDNYLFDTFNEQFCRLTGIDKTLFDNKLKEYASELKQRGKEESLVIDSKIKEIQALSHSDAINKLIESDKLPSKKRQIERNTKNI